MCSHTYNHLATATTAAITAAVATVAAAFPLAAPAPLVPPTWLATAAAFAAEPRSLHPSTSPPLRLHTYV